MTRARILKIAKRAGVRPLDPSTNKAKMRKFRTAAMKHLTRRLANILRALDVAVQHTRRRTEQQHAAHSSVASDDEVDDEAAEEAHLAGQLLTAHSDSESSNDSDSDDSGEPATPPPHRGPPYLVLRSPSPPAAVRGTAPSQRRGGRSVPTEDQLLRMRQRYYGAQIRRYEQVPFRAISPEGEADIHLGLPGPSPEDLPYLGSPYTGLGLFNGMRVIRVDGEWQVENESIRFRRDAVEIEDESSFGSGGSGIEE
ncbi:hypothetical protein R3P38DRAFT_3430421 [Favolaschia claudopus]|uniref:Uncharacterized protein n=1 Tax=Favolaschia claudopus TaxID=2862362 RepID=A0AAV9ZVP1_9AGAR